MITKHNLQVGNSADLSFIKDNSVNLVVTSPPYPMIDMWDDIFSLMNPNIKNELESGNGNRAFELMHLELDKIWEELFRVISPGGIVAINIGDATRTIDKNFQIYMNGSRIITKMIDLGFYALPRIIWQKTTNSPNKFMGSGMLPGGAYVTLEHEHILIFRKGRKKEYNNKERINRQNSAYFWEERNVWFSDIWNIKGERQKSLLGENRERTAAYPLELPLRIINMYSNYGDVVLDPFFGTGTTSIAAMILNRNSIGVDIDPSFIDTFEKRIDGIKQISSNYIENRIKNHKLFIDERQGNLKYVAENLNLAVMTKQEENIIFYTIETCSKKDDKFFETTYKKYNADYLL